MRCIPIAALKRKKQKGGNDGDDCAREKQKKHSENLRKTRSRSNHMNIQRSRTERLLYQGAGSMTANVITRRCPVALLRFGALSLQRLDISRCSLLKQILKSTPVVQAELNLRHKSFRHIDGNTTPLRAAVQDITLMLVTRQTCRAILPDAATPPPGSANQAPQAKDQPL